MNGSGTARILSRLWLLVIVVVAITVLYLAKVLFLPLAFAILFAFLLTPVVTLLERLRLPRALAAILVILTFAALLGTAAWMLFTQLVAVANDLPVYRDNITQKMEAIHSPSDSAFSRAQKELEKLSDELGLANSTAAPELRPAGKPGNKPLGSSPERPVQVREVARPTGRLDQLGGIVEPLTTAALSVVFTFFVLLQREDLRNRLIRLTGDRHVTVTIQAMNDATRRISRYFSLQLLINFIYGCLIWGALYLIGLPHALLFGSLAALFRFVPYIGSPVAALLPTLLSLAVFQGWTRTAMIGGIFMVLELFTANYAEPHVYGRHTGLSSLAILVAAAFWTLIWGPVGLALSVPLTVCLVVMGSHVPSLEFLTVMLGDQPVVPPFTCFYQRLLARDQHEATEILETCLKDGSIETIYDSVLIPALMLSEKDRLEGDLDESTIGFIRQAARDLIDELGFRDNGDTGTEGGMGGGAGHPGSGVPKALCIPVRDETDELGSMMLAQLLEKAGMEALAIPVRRADEVLAAVSAENPDVIFLSGMPPFAMARAHRLYRGLRAQNPQRKIMIGIWNYPDDVSKAAQKISRGEVIPVATTLAGALAQVRSYFGRTVEPSLALEEETSGPVTA
jgi:predicted PurR-regulated permease PerM/methylmalonyl-CoA mutase cobalamin-binding subunit